MSTGNYVFTLNNYAVIDPTCTEELVKVAEPDENIDNVKHACNRECCLWVFQFFFQR